MVAIESDAGRFKSYVAECGVAGDFIIHRLLIIGESCGLDIQALFDSLKAMNRP